MLKFIDSEGLIRSAQRVNGIQKLSKIVEETPEMLLTKYLSKQTFSTDDIANPGGYNFEFKLIGVKKIEDFNDTYGFVFSIEKGTVDLIMVDGGVYDLLGDDIREFDWWWEIESEIKEMLWDFIENFSKKIKLNINGVSLDLIFKKRKKSKSINEQTERSNKDRILEKQVKKMIDHFTKDIEFPENFYDFMVDVVEDKKYNRKILKVTTTMKKSFKNEDSDKVYAIKKKFMSKIEPMFKNKFDSISYGGCATLDEYYNLKKRGYL